MANYSITFNGAQSFFIDPSIVGNAPQVMISSIDLFFKHKPALDSNYSGVSTPGATLFIAETMYGVPRITRKSGIFTADGISTVDYFNINTSSDSSVPTNFRLNMPFLVDTNKEYSFIWTFDYLDQFELWKSVQGDILVGTTNTTSPGPSGSYTGTYYDFLNVFIADDNTDLDEYLKNWRAASDVDLKYNVYVSRFSHDGVPVTSNTSIDSGKIHERETANVSYSNNASSYDLRLGSYEFFSYEQERSTKFTFVGGQEVFQDTVPFPGGIANNKTYHSVSVVAGSNSVTALATLPNGQPFSWNNIFPALSIQHNVVFKSGDEYNIRWVSEIRSNTEVILSEPLTFTNATSSFMITPTGRAADFDKNSPFGINESYLVVANSTANSTVRFVNNSIETIAVSAGGIGYSNGDILYVLGFEDIPNKVKGGYKGIANIVTNSSGGIQTVYLSNLGAGFINSSSATYLISNSSSNSLASNTSSGSGASFNISVGSTVKTELTPNVFKGVKVRNIDIGYFLPFLELRNPAGVVYDFKIEMPYFRVDSLDASSGIEYYVSSNSAANKVQVTMYTENYTEDMPYTPVMPSKSNEFVIGYQDGAPNDKISNSDSFYSLSFRLHANIASNSDYTCTMIKGLPSVSIGKYIVNNDATDEHTDSGKAWAKHITKIAKFARPSEDIRVYLTAYRPANTDILVYARIHKEEDPEVFDDKNWSLLEQKNTSDLSSSLDTSDYVELEYGFHQIPPETTKLTGVAKTTLNSNVVTGSSTLFTSELVSGDVILLRQGLFPDNHLITVVDNIVSNTSMTITENIANSSLVTEGLTIEKIDPAYVSQAFNNIQKSNIVRYFNSTKTKFDGYDQVAIKVVFLSDSPHRVPTIDDIKVVGTSA